ncbi:hypothetical protein [Halopiger xanaduensis]|nr:hypothetical protein [Halopiger xanaduensis]
MAVQRLSSRTVGMAGVLSLAFLVLAYAGVQYILEQGWGLVFEVAYLLALLIGFAIVADRLFVQ